MPFHHTKSLHIFIVAPVFLTGCAAVSPQDAFQSVQGEVASQTGMQVVWNQGTARRSKGASESARQIPGAKPLNGG